MVDKEIKLKIQDWEVRWDLAHTMQLLDLTRPDWFL